MKYVVVIDTSGSMAYGEWPDVVHDVYEGLREKLLKIDPYIPVWFVTHKILDYRYIRWNADFIKVHFMVSPHEGTDFLPIKQIRDNLNADLVFIISDGGSGIIDNRWDLDHYVFVTDTPHALMVRTSMGLKNPIPLLIIDKKKNGILQWIKNTWKKFIDWGSSGGTIADMRTWAT